MNKIIWKDVKSIDLIIGTGEFPLWLIIEHAILNAWSE